MHREIRIPVLALAIAAAVILMTLPAYTCTAYADINGENGKTIPAATVNIPVRHEITGDKYTGSDSFEYILAGEDDETPMPEGAEGRIKSVTAAGDDDPDFGDIVFEYPGAYYYAVSRVDKQYDRLETDVRTFTVMIAKFNDGTTEMVLWNDAEEKVGEIVYTDIHKAPRKSPKTGDEGFREVFLRWLIIATVAVLGLIVAILCGAVDRISGAEE